MEHTIVLDLNNINEQCILTLTTVWCDRFIGKYMQDWEWKWEEGSLTIEFRFRNAQSATLFALRWL
jgi:hypothetical protein